MRIAIAAIALLGSVGCVRVSETTVREKAAADFACADYALTVVEVGPDVYRATGCGQELIYACAPTRPDARTADDFSDDAVMRCARTVE
jgi:hypothetical protein